MAKYRPISPAQAWRSGRSNNMTSVERFGEYYLLTNPATNSIGCYELVIRIAAAETGMSPDEFKNVLNRLEDISVATYRDGFILAKTWFLHNNWESTFTGNVAKAATAEVRGIPDDLVNAWSDACTASGVPQEAVDNMVRQALGSPLQGAPKGLPDNNQPNRTDFKHTTTTSDAALGKRDAAIELLPCAEPHRATLVELVQAASLNKEQTQHLAWELSQRLKDSIEGTGKPINHVRAWLTTLIEAQLAGKCILERGRHLATAIEARKQQLQNAEAEQAAAERLAASTEAKYRHAARVLAEIDGTVLQALAEAVPEATLGKRWIEACVRSVWARELPKGVVGATITRVMDQLGLLANAKTG